MEIIANIISTVQNKNYNNFTHSVMRKTVNTVTPQTYNLF